MLLRPGRVLRGSSSAYAIGGCEGSGICLRVRYAMSGTELSHQPTSSMVLSQRMVLPGGVYHQL
eukprot:3940254-Rhodomonas_salina.1